MQITKFNTKIIEGLNNDIKELLSSIDCEYTLLEDLVKEIKSVNGIKADALTEICEAIIHTSDVTGYDILSELENVDLIEDMQNTFNCEVEQLVILKDNNRYYMISKVYFQNREEAVHMLKQVDSANINKYLTTEIVVNCKAKEMQEIQCLTVLNMINLVSIYKNIEFNEAIELINEEYLKLIFETSTNANILECIPNITLNGLDGVNSSYTMERIYNENISDITWSSVLTSITMITETLYRNDSLIDAIKEAHKIAMEKSTVKYV